LLFNQIDPGTINAAVVLVIAHEMGHHVQYQEEYLLHPYENFCCNQGHKGGELSADCLAGVYWAKDPYIDGSVTNTDISAAMAMEALQDLGNEVSSSDTRDDHGTGQERVEAFQRGYATGDPDECMPRS
jgi:predicted metalloprotease